MASHGHAGHAKHSSSSPNVVGLNATKAPSLSAAKPRFRSRTGCWTCRRRKVKCDERGRNSETVAYGGPLSTASGCKRCEDSGRPCHGYGAQAPNRQLVNPYVSACTSGEIGNGSAPFYSFNHSTPEYPANLRCFSNYLTPPDTSPSMTLDIASWSRSPDSSKVGEQYIGAELHSQHISSSSSNLSTAPLLASTPPALQQQQASLDTPALDLRRYSVPSYPTWHIAGQERLDTTQYSTTGDFRDPFYLHNTPREVGIRGNPDPIYQHEGSIGDTIPENPPHIINSNSSPVNPPHIINSSKSPVSHPNGLNVTFPSNIRGHDPDARPYTQCANRSHLTSVDFGRPHTSSGVSLPHVSHTQLTQSRNYRSPIFPHPAVISGIQEPPYTSSVSPTTTNCSEVGRNAWSDTINGPTHSHGSVRGFDPIGYSLPGYRSPTTSDSMLPVNLGTCPTRTNAFTHSSNEPSNNSTVKARYEPFPSSNAVSSESDSHFVGGQKTNAPPSMGTFHLSANSIQYRGNIPPESQHFNGADMQRRLSSTHEIKDGSPMIKHSHAYVGSIETEPNQTIPDRKNSSSSSMSSLSTLDHNLSPKIQLPKRLSINHPCSPSDSPSPSSPGSNNQIIQNRFNQHPPPSMNMFDVLQHTNWSAPDEPARHEPQSHEFSINTSENGLGLVKTETISDDSPTSTTNSILSCTGRHQYDSHGSPRNFPAYGLSDEPETEFPTIYKFPRPHTPLNMANSAQRF